MTLATPMWVNGNLLVNSGVLDAGPAANTIHVGGNFQAGPSFVHRGNTVYMSGSGAQLISGDTPFGTLAVTNGAILPDDVSSDRPVAVTGMLIMGNGRFRPADGSSFTDVNLAGTGVLMSPPGGTLTVHGNWSAPGQWVHNGGTVRFDGGLQHLAGSSTNFYNVTTAAPTILDTGGYLLPSPARC